MALVNKPRASNDKGFKFEKTGQSLEGYYIETIEITLDGDLVKKHIFKTESGIVSVLGQAFLTREFKETPRGTYVRLTLLEEKEKVGKGWMKTYDVKWDLNNRLSGTESYVTPSTPAYDEEALDDGDDFEDAAGYTAPKAPAIAAAKASEAKQSSVLDLARKVRK